MADCLEITERSWRKVTRMEESSSSLATSSSSTTSSLSTMGQAKKQMAPARLSRTSGHSRLYRLGGLLRTEMIIWLIIDALAASTLANCPNRCVCDDRTLVVQCEEGALDVLPITLNPSIEQLVIRHNKIRTIDSSVQFYTELRHLDLSYNNLVSIPQNTFSNQRKLEALSLHHNKIGAISNKTFNGLIAVTVLNLRGNLLAELEDGTFRQMTKIEELNLGQNRISRIGTHAFDGLVNLRVLYLDDNTLTVVPAADVVKPMVNLAELYLGTNSFITIPPKAFEDLKGLTRLELRGAGLHNITAVALVGLEGLRYLDLSDNRLQVIPTSDLEHLQRLEELSIGQNDFEVIATGAFVGLNNLRRLEVVGARQLHTVEDGAFATNTNLEYLNLSTNKMLNHIHLNALSGLPHLQHVILKENQLSTLEEGLVPWSDLQTLDVSENPFVCDCRVLWLRTLLIAKNTSSEPLPKVLCAYPDNVREQSLTEIAPAAFGCSQSSSIRKTMLSAIVVAALVLVFALVLIVYVFRKRIREILKGGWGNSALGRKEREYQKTFSEEDYMTRSQHPCAKSIHTTATYPDGTGNCTPLQSQYMGGLPIPVTEL